MAAAGEPTSRESTTDAGAATCVLLCGAGIDPPAELLASLARRGVVVHRRADIYSALVALSRAAHTTGEDAPSALLLLLIEPAGHDGAADLVESARRHAPRASAWWIAGVQTGGLRAVTREDLNAWRAAKPAFGVVGVPVVTAAGRAFGKGGEIGRSGGVSGGTPGTAGRDPSATEPRRSNGHPFIPGKPVRIKGGEPSLRLVEPIGENGPGSAPEARREPQPPAASEVLTREELAMLLGDEIPTDPPPHPGPNAGIVNGTNGTNGTPRGGTSSSNGRDR